MTYNLTDQIEQWLIDSERAAIARQALMDSRNKAERKQGYCLVSIIANIIGFVAGIAIAAVLKV